MPTATFRHRIARVTYRCRMNLRYRAVSKSYARANPSGAFSIGTPDRRRYGMAKPPGNVPELLPRLRRFARVLTGSQEIGDSCVSAAVENVVHGKYPGVPARMALHRSVLAEVDATNAIPVSDRIAPRDLAGSADPTQTQPPWGKSRCPRARAHLADFSGTSKP